MQKLPREKPHRRTLGTSPAGDTSPGKRFRDVALGLSKEDYGGAQERALAAASPSGSTQSCFSSREMSRLCTGFFTWYDAVLNSRVAHFLDGKTRAACRSDIGEPTGFNYHWITMITLASKRPALEHGSEWLVIRRSGNFLYTAVLLSIHPRLL